MATQDSQLFRWHYTELGDKNFQLHGRSLLLLIILFSVCLVLTLFCLYARWLCRYQRLAALANGTPPAHAPTTMSKSVGLDNLTIESLPVHRYRSSADEAQCSICLSCYQEEESVKVLPGCHHGFHPECVDVWLSSHSNCPLCRASIQNCLVEPAHESV